MTEMELVVGNYRRGDLLAAIRAGVEKLGKSPQTITLDDLAPVDEFHIGGRTATQSFLDQLRIATEDHVLDVGCGIGGASRFAAHTYGCRVAGFDLTEEYVVTGNALCGWLGLEERIRLQPGNVLKIDVPDGTFDKAFMLHVGMNIPDKASLAAEVGRVLKPGGVFGIYDIMMTGDEDLRFPVPWASVPEASSLASLEEYRQLLESAGFEILGERNRREFADEFFATLKANAAAADGPPPLGLHLLMGETAGVKVQNMIENIARDRVAPVEIIARKR